MKKLIISGASGYIGRTFISKYKHDFEIIALSRNEKSLKEYDEYISIMSLEELERLDMDFSDYYLINLAFPRKSDMDLLMDSFEYTSRLLEKTVRNGLRKVINISSQSVYDKDRFDEAFEADIVKIFSLYGMAKIYSEHQIESYARLLDFDYIHLRLASVIGKNFNQRMINKFVANYFNNEDLNVIEKGERFSFINVNDVCSAIYEVVINQEIKWNEIYNVGSLDEYTITQIIDSIKAVSSNFNYKGNIVIEKSNIDINRTNKVSSNKFISNSHWKPDYNLQKCIEDISSEYIK